MLVLDCCYTAQVCAESGRANSFDSSGNLVFERLNINQYGLKQIISLEM